MAVTGPKTGFRADLISDPGGFSTWGQNQYGQLGDRTTTGKSIPVKIDTYQLLDISCGYYHTAAVKTDGTLWSWGRNQYGQLGNVTTTDYSSPIQVGSLTNWKQVACGYRHNTAIPFTDIS